MSLNKRNKKQEGVVGYSFGDGDHRDEPQTQHLQRHSDQGSRGIEIEPRLGESRENKTPRTRGIPLSEIEKDATHQLLDNLDNDTQDGNQAQIPDFTQPYEQPNKKGSKVQQNPKKDPLKSGKEENANNGAASLVGGNRATIVSHRASPVNNDQQQSMMMTPPHDKGRRASEKSPLVVEREPPSPDAALTLTPQGKGYLKSVQMNSSALQMHHHNNKVGGIQGQQSSLETRKRKGQQTGVVGSIQQQHSSQTSQPLQKRNERENSLNAAHHSQNKNNHAAKAGIIGGVLTGSGLNKKVLASQQDSTDSAGHLHSERAENHRLSAALNTSKQTQKVGGGSHHGVQQKQLAHKSGNNQRLQSQRMNSPKTHILVGERQIGGQNSQYRQPVAGVNNQNNMGGLATISATSGGNPQITTNRKVMQISATSTMQVEVSQTQPLQYQPLQPYLLDTVSGPIPLAQNDEFQQQEAAQYHQNNQKQFQSINQTGTITRSGLAGGTQKVLRNEKSIEKVPKLVKGAAGTSSKKSIVKTNDQQQSLNVASATIIASSADLVVNSPQTSLQGGGGVGGGSGGEKSEKKQQGFTQRGRKTIKEKRQSSPFGNQSAVFIQSPKIIVQRKGSTESKTELQRQNANKNTRSQKSIESTNSQKVLRRLAQPPTTTIQALPGMVIESQQQRLAINNNPVATSNVQSSSKTQLLAKNSQNSSPAKQGSLKNNDSFSNLPANNQLKLQQKSSVNSQMNSPSPLLMNSKMISTVDATPQLNFNERLLTIDNQGIRPTLIADSHQLPTPSLHHQHNGTDQQLLTQQQQNVLNFQQKLQTNNSGSQTIQWQNDQQLQDFQQEHQNDRKNHAAGLVEGSQQELASYVNNGQMQMQQPSLKGISPFPNQLMFPPTNTFSPQNTNANAQQYVNNTNLMQQTGANQQNNFNIPSQEEIMNKSYRFQQNTSSRREDTQKGTGLEGGLAANQDYVSQYQMLSTLGQKNETRGRKNSHVNNNTANLLQKEFNSTTGSKRSQGLGIMMGTHQEFDPLKSINSNQKHQSSQGQATGNSRAFITHHTIHNNNQISPIHGHLSTTQNSNGLGQGLGSNMGTQSVIRGAQRDQIEMAVAEDKRLREQQRHQSLKKISERRLVASRSRQAHKQQNLNLTLDDASKPADLIEGARTDVRAKDRKNSHKPDLFGEKTEKMTTLEAISTKNAKNKVKLTDDGMREARNLVLPRSLYYTNGYMPKLGDLREALRNNKIFHHQYNPQFESAAFRKYHAEALKLLKEDPQNVDLDLENEIEVLDLLQPHHQRMQEKKLEKVKERQAFEKALHSQARIEKTAKKLAESTVGREERLKKIKEVKYPDVKQRKVIVRPNPFKGEYDGEHIARLLKLQATDPQFKVLTDFLIRMREEDISLPKSLFDSDPARRKQIQIYIDEEIKKMTSTESSSQKFERMRKHIEMMVDAGYTFKKDNSQDEIDWSTSLDMQRTPRSLKKAKNTSLKRDGSHLSNLSAFAGANSDLGLQSQQGSVGKSIIGSANPFNGSKEQQSVASVPIDLSMIDQRSEMPVYSVGRQRPSPDFVPKGKIKPSGMLRAAQRRMTEADLKLAENQARKGQMLLDAQKAKLKHVQPSSSSKFQLLLSTSNINRQGAGSGNKKQSKLLTARKPNETIYEVIGGEQDELYQAQVQSQDDEQNQKNTTPVRKSLILNEDMMLDNRSIDGGEIKMRDLDVLELRKSKDQARRNESITKTHQRVLRKSKDENDLRLMRVGSGDLTNQSNENFRTNPQLKHGVNSGKKASPLTQRKSGKNSPNLIMFGKESGKNGGLRGMIRDQSAQQILTDNDPMTLSNSNLHILDSNVSQKKNHTQSNPVLPPYQFGMRGSSIVKDQQFNNQDEQQQQQYQASFGDEASRILSQDDNQSSPSYQQQQLLLNQVHYVKHERSAAQLLSAKKLNDLYKPVLQKQACNHCIKTKNDEFVRNQEIFELSNYTGGPETTKASTYQKVASEFLGVDPSTLFEIDRDIKGDLMQQLSGEGTIKKSYEKDSQNTSAPASPAVEPWLLNQKASKAQHEAQFYGFSTSQQSQDDNPDKNNKNIHQHHLGRFGGMNHQDSTFEIGMGNHQDGSSSIYSHPYSGSSSTQPKNSPYRQMLSRKAPDVIKSLLRRIDNTKQVHKTIAKDEEIEVDKQWVEANKHVDRWQRLIKENLNNPEGEVLLWDELKEKTRRTALTNAEIIEGIDDLRKKQNLVQLAEIFKQDVRGKEFFMPKHPRMSKELKQYLYTKFGTKNQI